MVAVQAKAKTKAPTTWAGTAKDGAMRPRILREKRRAIQTSNAPGMARMKAAANARPRETPSNM